MIRTSCANKTLWPIKHLWKNITNKLIVDELFDYLICNGVSLGKTQFYKYNGWKNKNMDTFPYDIGDVLTLKTIIFNKTFGISNAKN